MSGTKDKIIIAAVERFNERGFVNVTMREIAAELGISPGNLAYHFRNKGAMLQEIYRRMSEELGELVSGIRLIPSFDNIDYEITTFLEYQRRYCFFYLDTLEICRAHPDIAAEHRQQISGQIAAIRAVIDYSVQSGNMVQERFSGLYDHLARTVYTIWSSWLSQALLLQTDSSSFQVEGRSSALRSLGKGQTSLRGTLLEQHPGDLQARKAIWTLVLPYLSAKGRHNFETVAFRHGLTEKPIP